MRIEEIQVDAGSKAPPAGDGRLDELRALVGVDLPAPFVAFLKTAGGRRISKYGFKSGDYTGTFACPVVYSLHADFGEYDLIKELRDARTHNGVPPEVVPFACCLNGPSDGVMYLDLTQKGGGRVTAYMAGKPAWTGRNTRGAWIDVADSFQGYLEALLVDSDD